jgi:hypothetical protein
MRWVCKREGAAHNHYIVAVEQKSLSIFSVEDLAMLYEYYNLNKMQSKSKFTFVMVTATTSYIIMIDNKNNFEQMGSEWLATPKKVSNLQKWMYSDFPEVNINAVHQDSTDVVNEKNFLYNIMHLSFSGNGGGIKVFSGNTNMTAFTPIKVDENKNLISNPCN